MAKKTSKKTSKKKSSRRSDQTTGRVKPRKVKPQTPQKFPDFWTQPMIMGGILLFAIVLYFITFNYGYILDDKIFLSENNYVNQGFAGIWNLFAEESMAGYFGEQKDLITGARYRPLSLVSFAIENQFLGLKPGFSHIVNALLYGITGMLIFYVCALFWPAESGRPWYMKIGFWAAILFIAHPVHTEVVANIKGRDEILALLFAVLTLIKGFKAKSSMDYILTGFFFYLALLSKENAITYLAVIPASLFIFRKNRISGQEWRNLILALLGATIIYLFQRYMVIGYFLSSGKEITELLNNPFVEMNGAEKYATIFYTLIKYVQLLFWPHPLSHDYYPYAIATKDWTHWASILSLILYAAAAIFVLLKLRKKNIYTYLIFCFFATLSIVSNIPFTVGTTMNERFIYMPSLSFALFVPYLLISGWKTISPTVKKVGIAAMIIYTLVFSFLTIRRLPVWADALSLNRSAVSVYPNSARSSLFMGTALYNEANEIEDTNEKMAVYDESLGHIGRALRIYPNYGNALKMKAGVAAQKYSIDGNLPQLLNTFSEVAAVRPALRYLHEYLQYLNGRGTAYPALMDFYYRVGFVELSEKQGLNQWAEKFLRYGYELDPGNSQVASALATVYDRLGMSDRAAQIRIQMN